MQNPGFNVKCFFTTSTSNDGPDYQDHFWHVFTLNEVLEYIVEEMIVKRYLIEEDEIVVYDVINNIRYHFRIVPSEDPLFEGIRTVYGRRFQLLSRARSMKDSPSMSKYEEYSLQNN